VGGTCLWLQQASKEEKGEEEEEYEALEEECGPQDESKPKLHSLNTYVFTVMQ
jgi:hypothetical protein